MLAILLALPYFLINLYMLRRCLQWIGAVIKHRAARGVKISFSGVYLFMMLTPLTSFLVPQENFRFFLKYLNNFWLGFVLYLLLLTGMADGVRLILKKMRAIPRTEGKQRAFHIAAGTMVGVLSLSVALYGHGHAYDLKVREYDIKVEKTMGGISRLNIVMLADLHLGYNTRERYLKGLVDTINRQNPDLVCIAGDIFDNEYEAMKDPDAFCGILSRIKSRYGVFACYGNHDVDEKILAGFTFGSSQGKTSSQNMRDFLRKAGIQMLADETVLIDGKFYLTGRRDASKPQDPSGTRLAPEVLFETLDPTKPIIVMDHQPKELEALARAGADIDLGGHTHNGQLFPGNLFMKLAWEEPWGYLQKDGMHLIVTSGAGVWGPSMRVGTDSEITVIRAAFETA